MIEICSFRRFEFTIQLIRVGTISGPHLTSIKIPLLLGIVLKTSLSKGIDCGAKSPLYYVDASSLLNSA